MLLTFLREDLLSKKLLTCVQCVSRLRQKFESTQKKLKAPILTKKENFINQHHTFLDPPKEWLELSKSIILFWLTNQRTPLKKTLC